MTSFIIIVVILAGVSIGSWIYAYGLSKDNKEITTINKERQKENDLLDREVEIKRRELQSKQEEIEKKQKEFEQVRDSIVTQNSILTSLTKSSEALRNSAQERAKEYYDNSIADLRNSYQKVYEDLDIKMRDTRERITQEEIKVESLKAKQLAYIEAQQREEEISANQDYYRLIIDELELNDVKMLRDVQAHFVKKESIDKLIWENYYKLPFDVLTAKFFTAGDKVCGIYKITSLTTGKTYIGQSVDIRERWRQHIKAALTYGKPSNKLYQAMQNEGPENFTFEILEKVPRADLNERETYWIDFYKTKEFGLNVTKGNS